jgi:hypothetical protein
VRRPVSLLPALVGAAAVAAAGLVTAPASAAPATAAVARAPAEADDPLEVRIESLTPSSVPNRGRVRIRGTVTNVSEERWRAINVHAFMAAEPMTSADELAEATRTPVDAEVGDRITIPGTFDPVGSLDPGQTVRFHVRLRRDQLPASEPGVYWFGAHALGNTDEARDGVADGRARTFLPLVPRTRQTTRDPVQVALVMPLRHTIRHRPNGRIQGGRRWAEELEPGGRLAAQLDLAAAPGAGPLTWLVDPAVPDAVAHLAAGNPPRSLADTLPADPEDPDPPGSSESPTAEQVEESGSDEERDEDAADRVAEVADDWLGGLRPTLATDAVLTLPWGDPDLAAVAEYAPGWYARSVDRPGTLLDRWETRTEPAAGSPSGYVSTGELGLLRDDETVIAGDRALPGVTAPLPARVDGHRVVFASSATASGGPGPEDPLTAVALRQRIVADAALRLLFHDRAPLVVVLPEAFGPASPQQFWSGLDPDWLALSDVSELENGPALPADRLDYPVEEELTELDEPAFEAAADLVAAGRTLEELLTLNDAVGDQVLGEALSGISYQHRDRALEARTEVIRGTQWIQRRMGTVRLRAPNGVTLASDTGNFAATIANGLPHPVTVSLDAVSQGDVVVEPPARIQLPARGRQTVVLEASASSPGVHYVQLMVTDGTGTPLGAARQVPIRSAQVSRVIWLILGVGVGLLLLAIGNRVVHRVRNQTT